MRQGERFREENAQVVTVRTETELRQALLTLRTGQTVAVDAAEIALTDTLIIAVRNVTLKAARETPVVVRCPRRAQRNALRIQYVFDFVSHFRERTLSYTGEVTHEYPLCISLTVPKRPSSSSVADVEE